MWKKGRSRKKLKLVGQEEMHVRACLCTLIELYLTFFFLPQEICFQHRLTSKHDSLGHIRTQHQTEGQP